jgi:hypothetical protein
VNYLGIDPGKDGAIAILLLPNNLQVFRFSKDLPSFLDLWRTVHLDTIVYQEDVHAIYRAKASSTFSFGRSVGFWDGLFYALPPKDRFFVTPTVWQKSVQIAQARVKGRSRKEHRQRIKAASMRVASLYAGFKVSHDGVADAINILRYGLLQD